MKLPIFLTLLAFAANAHTVDVLTNSNYDKVYNRIQSARDRRFFRKTYLQCASGFRNAEKDPLCQKIAYILFIIEE